MLKKYDDFVETEQALSHQAADDAIRHYQLSLYSMLVLGIVLLSLGLFISIFVIRRVTHAEANALQLNTDLEEKVN